MDLIEHLKMKWRSNRAYQQYYVGVAVLVYVIFGNILMNHGIHIPKYLTLLVIGAAILFYINYVIATGKVYLNVGAVGAYAIKRSKHPFIFWMKVSMIIIVFLMLIYWALPVDYTKPIDEFFR